MITSKKSGRWAILVHQLPVAPTNIRVTIWRRLQQLGAVALRNSVYVLPNTPEAQEDFEWLRSEIIGLGGSATVMAADMVDSLTSEELIARFQQQRRDDYARLTRSAARVLTRRRSKTGLASRATTERQAQALRARYARIRAIDYFDASNRTLAATAMGKLAKVGPTRRRGNHAPQPATPLSTYRKSIWVTRARPGVDRMASAWFIRKHINPSARFVFVASEARVGSSRVPFDMYEVEFGHHGSHCTLETFMDVFGVNDPATVRLSQVVHDLDLKDARYGLPECPAIGRLVDGLRQLYADDHELLNQGMVLMEALYRSFDSERTDNE